LGERQVFSEVARTEVADPALADYIVSGTYDFSEGTVQDTYADWHSITVLGILHIRVVRAKDNVVVLDKDFTEERTDGARRNVTVHVNYLQSAFIEPITAEIKRMVAADLSAFKSTAPVKTPAVSP